MNHEIEKTQIFNLGKLYYVYIFGWIRKFIERTSNVIEYIVQSYKHKDCEISSTKTQKSSTL